MRLYIVFCIFQLLLVSIAKSQQIPDVEQFLIRGQPITDQTPGLTSRDVERYRRAIEHYAETDCSVRDATGARLNWPVVRSSVDVDVCLFFALSDLGGGQTIEEYLADSGFFNILNRPYQPFAHIDTDMHDATHTVSGSMSVSQLPEGFGGWLGSEKWAAHSYSVIVHLDQYDLPINVISTYTRE